MKWILLCKWSDRGRTTWDLFENVVVHRRAGILMLHLLVGVARVRLHGPPDCFDEVMSPNVDWRAGHQCGRWSWLEPCRSEKNKRGWNSYIYTFCMAIRKRHVILWNFSGFGESNIIFFTINEKKFNFRLKAEKNIALFRESSLVVRSIKFSIKQRVKEK